ncbi:MAG: NHL repeat-containing protein [Candidatus Aminicenantales bacterium]
MLKKIGEITGKIPECGIDAFWRPWGIACDKKSNVFILDSGHNMIFRFDPDGKFVSSFGRKGQGPGEFMGQPRGGGLLKISIGNDGNLYVFDPANRRLSRFSGGGEFLGQFETPRFLYDVPAVNSRGDLYFVSTGGKKFVDCFDRNYVFKHSLLDMEEKPEFPIEGSAGADYYREPDGSEILRLVTGDDRLIVFHGRTLLVSVLSPDDRLEKQFKVGTKPFIDELKKQDKESRQRAKQFEKRYQIDSSRYKSPFRAFLDHQGNLCLAGRSSTKSDAVILRYGLDGNFLGILKFPENVSTESITCDGRGRIYVLRDSLTEFGIYQLE